MSLIHVPPEELLGEPSDGSYDLDEEGQEWRRWVESLHPRFEPVVFFTGTFELPATVERARDAHRWLVRKISRRPEALGNVRGRAEDLPWLAAYERHSILDSFHVHSLIEGCGNVDLGWMHDLWYHRFGICKAVRYDLAKDGVGYLLKHAGAEAVIDPARELKPRTTRALPR